jgi:acyl-CoA thioesterase-1
MDSFCCNPLPKMVKKIAARVIYTAATAHSKPVPSIFAIALNLSSPLTPSHMCKFPFTLALLLLLCFFCKAQKKVIAVIGSSTAYGAGANPIDSSWVNLLKKYYQDLKEIDTIYNLAFSGSITFYGMPTGSVPPDSFASFQPDSTINVTKALSYNPDIVIISYPTNDIADSIPLHFFLSNLRAMDSAVLAAGKICYMATTQPRDNLVSSESIALVQGRDSILQEFPAFGLDFFAPLVDPNPANVAQINPIFNSGDGIHPNNAGHQLLFQVAKNNIVLQNIPLALVTTGFAGTAVNSGILLNWASNAGDNTVFTVERSGDTSHFADLELQQATNGSQPSNYSWTDANPITGDNYYRLRTASGGSDSYSGTLHFFFKRGKTIGKVFLSGPETLSVEIDANQATTVELLVYDIAGAQVRRKSAEVQGPASTVFVSLSGLPAGEYLLKMTATDGTPQTMAFFKPQ